MLPIGQALAQMPHLEQECSSTKKCLSVTICLLKYLPNTYDRNEGNSPFLSVKIPHCLSATLCEIVSNVLRAASVFLASIFVPSVSMNGRHTYVLGIAMENALSVCSPIAIKSLFRMSIARPVSSPHVHTA